jgi:hypothetical protein
MSFMLESTFVANSVRRYPAPWKLRGKGYILLYRFPRDFSLQQGLIPPFLRDSYAGGLGAVMLIDYAESNAGPYGELLFIPGRFRCRGKKLDCITKIYVSTMESVVNGWENWAIPKEQANFAFAAPENQETERVLVTRGREPVLDVTLRCGGISFPIHTALLPFPLVQEKDGELYFTRFTGTGTARFAHVEEMSVNSELFPNIQPYHPLMCMRVEHFAITFPPARTARLVH